MLIATPTNLVNVERPSALAPMPDWRQCSADLSTSFRRTGGTANPTLSVLRDARPQEAFEALEPATRLLVALEIGRYVAENKKPMSYPTPVRYAMNVLISLEEMVDEAQLSILEDPRHPDIALALRVAGTVVTNNPKLGTAILALRREPLAVDFRRNDPAAYAEWLRAVSNYSFTAFDGMELAQQLQKEMAYLEPGIVDPAAVTQDIVQGVWARYAGAVLAAAPVHLPAEAVTAVHLDVRSTAFDLAWNTRTGQGHVVLQSLAWGSPIHSEFLKAVRTDPTANARQLFAQVVTEFESEGIGSCEPVPDLIRYTTARAGLERRDPDSRTLVEVELAERHLGECFPLLRSGRDIGGALPQIVDGSRASLTLESLGDGRRFMSAVEAIAPRELVFQPADRNPAEFSVAPTALLGIQKVRVNLTSLYADPVGNLGPFSQGIHLTLSGSVESLANYLSDRRQPSPLLRAAAEVTLEIPGSRFSHGDDYQDLRFVMSRLEKHKVPDITLITNAGCLDCLGSEHPIWRRISGLNLTEAHLGTYTQLAGMKLMNLRKLRLSGDSGGVGMLKQGLWFSGLEELGLNAHLDGQAVAHLLDGAWFSKLASFSCSIQGSGASPFKARRFAPRHLCLVTGSPETAIPSLAACLTDPSQVSVLEIDSSARLQSCITGLTSSNLDGVHTLKVRNAAVVDGEKTDLAPFLASRKEPGVIKLVVSPRVDADNLAIPSSFASRTYSGQVDPSYGLSRPNEIYLWPSW